MATEGNPLAGREPRTEASPASRRTEAVMRPPVDIYEDRDGITLLADMPGVSRERLDLKVDGNTLLLEGQVEIELPPKAEALHAEVRSRLYRRSFALSRELATDRIEASLKDGLLSVRIPKRAELQPRRIEVESR